MAKGDKEKYTTNLTITAVVGRIPYGKEGNELFKVKAETAQGDEYEYACFSKGLWPFLETTEETFKADCERKEGEWNGSKTYNHSISQAYKADGSPIAEKKPWGGGGGGMTAEVATVLGDNLGNYIVMAAQELTNGFQEITDKYLEYLEAHSWALPGKSEDASEPLPDMKEEEQALPSDSTPASHPMSLTMQTKIKDIGDLMNKATKELKFSLSSVKLILDVDDPTKILKKNLQDSWEKLFDAWILHVELENGQARTGDDEQLPS